MAFKDAPDLEMNIKLLLAGVDLTHCLGGYKPRIQKKLIAFVKLRSASTPPAGLPLGAPGCDDGAFTHFGVSRVFVQSLLVVLAVFEKILIYHPSLAAHNSPSRSAVHRPNQAKSILEIHLLIVACDGLGGVCFR